MGNPCLQWRVISPHCNLLQAPNFNVGKNFSVILINLRRRIARFSAKNRTSDQKKVSGNRAPPKSNLSGRLQPTPHQPHPACARAYPPPRARAHPQRPRSFCQPSPTFGIGHRLARVLDRAVTPQLPAGRKLHHHHTGVPKRMCGEAQQDAPYRPHPVIPASHTANRRRDASRLQVHTRIGVYPSPGPGPHHQTAA